MNAAVNSGELKGPIVISRDHHDVSGTDSPYRETSNIEDGSQFCADMAVQNFVGDAFRGGKKKKNFISYFPPFFQQPGFPSTTAVAQAGARQPTVASVWF